MSSVFYSILDFTIFCLFLYVDVKARKQERYTTGQIIGRLIPIGVAVVTVIFGRLYYHVGMDGRYSYGPMAYMIYVIMAVFMLLTIYKRFAIEIVSRGMRKIIYCMA